MNVVGLFSGIGGLELAFSLAGFETAMLVEIDEAARVVLEERFTGKDIRRDVRELRDLPTDAQIVTAGFPCQNLSMAGDKSGLAGAKSGIVGDMFRLLRGSKVKTVVIENINFMLSLDRGSAMSRLVQEFETLGFHWAYRVLDTMNFGLPQRRRRVYMVASKCMDPRGALFDEETAMASPPTPDLTKPLGFYWTEGRSGIGLTLDGVPPIKVGSSLGIASAPAVLFRDGSVLMPSLAACERLQGFPSGWTTTNGALPGRNPKWRLVGNAVSVPVAQKVAERIKNRVTPPQIDLPIKASAPWPEAAWNLGRGRRTPATKTRPAGPTAPSIDQFRDPDWTLLSDRALDGFIARAQSGGLKMPAGFLDALRAALRKPATKKIAARP
jgi:DNA (cytosine-5)-methyltransferase 1